MITGTALFPPSAVEKAVRAAIDRTLVNRESAAEDEYGDVVEIKVLGRWVSPQQVMDALDRFPDRNYETSASSEGSFDLFVWPAGTKCGSKNPKEGWIKTTFDPADPVELAFKSDGAFQTMEHSFECEAPEDAA